MEEMDIKELLYEIWKGKTLIVLFAVLGIIIGICYSTFLVTPMYRSVTTLVLSKANTDNDTTTTITTNDITMNQKLVSTYSEIMKSKTVVKQVIEKLNLDMKEDDLISNISVQSKKDTELLEIMVSYDTPHIAAEIANTLAEVFTAKVKEVYNIENVSVIDVAEPNAIPYNINTIKTTSIFAMISIFIAFIIIFIKMFFNNTIKSQEDIEKLLGLPVLAVIPELKD